MTWYIVIALWLLAGLVIGTIVGKIIALGEAAPCPGRHAEQGTQQCMDGTHGG
jgi:hypothetical protein